MSRQIKTFAFLALFASLALSACGGGGEAESNAVLTEAAQIAIEGLTQTAEARPTNTNTPEPTATLTEVPTQAPTNTPEGGPASPTPTVESSQNTGNTGATTSSSNDQCYRASFETETVPDGTRFYTDETFTKSWRLKNTGTCTWEPSINVIWVEGDLMGADSVNAITTEAIAPGQYVSVEVTMTTPSEPGIYKGYWMLRSGDGRIFGVGQDGKGWFWVEVESYSRE